MALGVLLVWIAALKFYDPSPVRGLLAASLPVFAHNAFPVLSLLGQFLHKDTVLAAAAINLIALDSKRAMSRQGATEMRKAA